MRPEDCSCREGQPSDGLPCWECYRAGFDDPNPDPHAEDRGRDLQAQRDQLTLEEAKAVAGGPQ